MNKILISGILITALLLPVSLLAEETSEGSDDSLRGLTAEMAQEAGFEASEEGVDDTLFAVILGTVARIFISLLGVLFISYLIYAGYLWMTAAGNEEKITKSKAIMKGLIIGLIIILGSAAIYYFVRDAIIGMSGTSTGVPHGS